MIIGLMDTDVGKQWDSWQEQVTKIKAVFTKEQSTSDPAAVREWRSHWEQQLFKAYEVQYRMHLESLSETMPEVQVELCYAGRKAPGKLTFRPALPDLRTKYYRQLRAFIDMPKTFQGLGDATLYASIPDRCGPALALVYKAAEALFEQLKVVLKQYEPWVAFGTVDMDEFVSERLTETAEWEANFQALKAKRKDMDKLPNTVKVGCFQVSFAPFKSAVDDMMHKLSDALLVSLRKSASNDLKSANEYLTSAMDRLNNRPHTVEEMTIAKKEVEVIAARKMEISQSVAKLQRKAELLHHMLGVVLDKGDLEERWKQFEEYMGGFDDMLREQKDKLKEDIARRVKECKLNTEKFASKWKELKPKADVKDITKDQADGNVAAMADWQAEVKVLLDTAKEVSANSETFGMGVPSFQVLDEVKVEIDSFTDSWSLYGEYAKELDVMVNENWLAFRAHVLTFDGKPYTSCSSLVQSYDGTVLFDG
jgi:dynein heavy chain 2